MPYGPAKEGNYYLSTTSIAGSSAGQGVSKGYYGHHAVLVPPHCRPLFRQRTQSTYNKSLPTFKGNQRNAKWAKVLQEPSARKETIHRQQKVIPTTRGRRTCVTKVPRNTSRSLLFSSKRNAVRKVQSARVLKEFPRRVCQKAKVNVGRRQPGH